MDKQTIGFTGNQLKIFALICMTLDHVGVLLLPQYLIFRYIGRLSLPIFAWMIAEGCRYTKNKVRYLLTMASVAFICQVVSFVTTRSLLQCILVTFSLSLILIYSLDFATREKSRSSLCLLLSAFAAIVGICIVLPQLIEGFRVEYGFFGVLLPAVVYVGRTREEKLFLAACCLAGIAVDRELWQWISFAALPLLYFYNGERGRAKLKYLFYIYYPLHLALLYGISYFCSLCS